MVTSDVAIVFAYCVPVWKVRKQGGFGASWQEVFTTSEEKTGMQSSATPFGRRVRAGSGNAEAIGADVGPERYRARFRYVEPCLQGTSDDVDRAPVYRSRSSGGGA